jgi:FKBP-type peptidyl-prolyl cis-trans isomerase FklB
MKPCIPALAAVFVVSCSGSARDAAPVELKDDQAKASYAIGLNLGMMLKRSAVEVDPAIVAKGVRDGIAGKPALSAAQVSEVLAQLQSTIETRHAALAAQQSATGKTEGAAFLKANGAKRGVVTLPSGMQYQILTAGTGPRPTLSDKVSCNYRGTLLNGTEFDSSYAHGGPATLEVGGVIKGWTEALQLMPVGSKWRLFVPANLAYGEEGAGGAIPPNATLIFEIELLAIQK